MTTTSETSPPAPAILAPHHQHARTLLVYGTWTYAAGLALHLLVSVADRLTLWPAALHLLAAACLTIPPVLTWRGNEGWKHLTGAIGLLLAMASLPGCLLMMDPKENLSGIAALLAFLLGCYTVKVFLINQPVKDYFPELQRKHHQPDRTAALVERSLQRAIWIAVYILVANHILVFLRDRL